MSSIESTFNILSSPHRTAPRRAMPRRTAPDHSRPNHTELDPYLAMPNTTSPNRISPRQASSSPRPAIPLLTEPDITRPHRAAPKQATPQPCRASPDRARPRIAQPNTTSRHPASPRHTKPRRARPRLILTRSSPEKTRHDQAPPDPTIRHATRPLLAVPRRTLPHPHLTEPSIARPERNPANQARPRSVRPPCNPDRRTPSACVDAATGRTRCLHSAVSFGYPNPFHFWGGMPTDPLPLDPLSGRHNSLVPHRARQNRPEGLRLPRMGQPGLPDIAGAEWNAGSRELQHCHIREFLPGLIGVCFGLRDGPIAGGFWSPRSRY